METLVIFIARIAIILYILAAVGIFFSIRTLVQAQQARRLAIFGLEKEAARQQQRRAANTIIFLLLIAFMVYIISRVIEPNLQVGTIEPTPTPIVFVTAQPTPTRALVLYPTITPTSELAPADAGDSTPEPGASPVNGCEIFGATITDPQPGQTVSGQVAVSGSANILNFLLYKFELKGAATQNQWIVVGTFTSPVVEGFLGTFDSTSLPPGSYVLRLVVTDVDGRFPTPCEVPITIAPPGGES